MDSGVTQQQERLSHIAVRHATTVEASHRHVLMVASTIPTKAAAMHSKYQSCRVQSWISNQTCQGLLQSVLDWLLQMASEHRKGQSLAHIP